MNMKLIASILPLLFSCNTTYGAEFTYTGNDLLSDCTDLVIVADNPESTSPQRIQKMYKGTMCMGFIEGYHSGASVMVELVKRLEPLKLNSLQRPWKLSNNTDATQIARAVVKSLKNTPDKLHMPARLLMLEILIENYPNINN